MKRHKNWRNSIRVHTLTLCIIGRSYSGRGKYLQNCNSVVIMHRRTWIEPHHPLLVSSGPLQNFVEVETDFSDLEQKVMALLQDPDQAQQIAERGIETFRDRYLTPAAQACYWRQMFSGWAKVSLTPEKWEIEEMSGRKKTRGVPFVKPRKCRSVAVPLRGVTILL